MSNEVDDNFMTSFYEDAEMTMIVDDIPESQVTSVVGGTLDLVKGVCTVLGLGTEQSFLI